MSSEISHLQLFHEQGLFAGFLGVRLSTDHEEIGPTGKGHYLREILSLAETKIKPLVDELNGSWPVKIG